MDFNDLMRQEIKQLNWRHKVARDMFLSAPNIHYSFSENDVLTVYYPFTSDMERVSKKEEVRLALKEACRQTGFLVKDEDIIFSSQCLLPV